MPNSVCHLDDKVDIRGTNGYVVIPPSNHISGREYVVENPYYEIANLPEWAYKILTSTKPTKGIAPSLDFYLLIEQEGFKRVKNCFQLENNIVST